MIMVDDNDQLTKILQNTAKTEERTRNIERNLKDLQNRYIEESTVQDERITLLERESERHKVILSGALVAVGGALTAFYNWISGIL